MLILVKHICKVLLSWKTYLDHADFSRAFLVDTNFNRAMMIKSIFNDANMLRTQAPNITFDQCEFVGSILRDIRVSPGTQFSYCNFTDTSNLYQMNFTNVGLQSSYFKNVYMHDNVFVGADPQSV